MQCFESGASTIEILDFHTHYTKTAILYQTHLAMFLL